MKRTYSGRFKTPVPCSKSVSVAQEVPAGDYRIQSPCRLQLVGPSGSGKSTLLKKLVKDDSVWKEPVKHVIYCAPTLRDRQEYVEDLEATARHGKKTLWCTEGIPDVEEILNFSQNHSTLLLCDDLPLFDDTRGLNALIGMHGRHWRINIVLAVQNPYLKKPGLDMAFISRNLTGCIVLGSRADALVFSIMNHRLFPERKNFLLDCLNDARDNQNCCYVYIDLHPHAFMPRKFMLSTRIFRDERVGGENGSPLFYVLERHKK